jgi:hypothetical protein
MVGGANVVLNPHLPLEDSFACLQVPKCIPETKQKSECENHSQKEMHSHFFTRSNLNSTRNNMPHQVVEQLVFPYSLNVAKEGIIFVLGNLVLS